MDNRYNKRPVDRDWFRQSFLLTEDELFRSDRIVRTLTDADLKFTDTTIGGHVAINMPYQFTRYADLKTGMAYRGNAPLNRAALEPDDDGIPSYRVPGQSRMQDVIGDIRDDYESFKSAQAGFFGMGRYYQEAIERHAQVIHMRFGVPEYNSLTRFFTSFYSPPASELAHSGRGVSGFVIDLAGAAGALLGKVAAVPFYPLVLGGRVLRTLADVPSSKFYYLRPTMALYRQAASTILNGLAVNLGISPYTPEAARRPTYSEFENKAFDEEYISDYHRMLPDIVKEDGHIDLYAITTRYQRKANRLNDMLRDATGQSRISPWTKLTDTLRKFAQQTNAATGSSDGRALAQYLQDYMSISDNQPLDKDGDITINVMEDAPGDGSGEIASGRSKYTRSMLGHLSEFASMFESEHDDGGQFVSFRVENPGQMSESFSNTTRESDLSQKINSASAQMRSTRFDFADGNVGGGLGTVVKAFQNFASRALEQVQLSGLIGLSGLAFVDIPKTWDNSTAQLPRADFNIQLRTPYGNKISQFFDLYVPLSLLLAGALPISTGMQSYTSPFICEIYSKSRVAIRLGMIEQMTVTRAVNNLPFSEDGIPNGIDISFTVVDLSSILHMPIATNFGIVRNTQRSLNTILEGVGADTVVNASEAIQAATHASAYTEDNPFNDYLAVLGGLSLDQMVYGLRKLAMSYARERQNLRAWRTPAAIAASASDTMAGRFIRAIARPSDRATDVRN